MGRQNDVSRLILITAFVLATGGCAVFGGGAGEDVGTPEPSAPATGGQPSSEAAQDTAPARPEGTMENLFAAREYAGALALFEADSTLHTGEDELYLAGLAAAMSGHPRHDPRRAAAHFRRLLELHPDTDWRPEAELYLEMIARERDLRATIDRLDRELRQLKAIDLGEQPEEVDP